MNCIKPNCKANALKNDNFCFFHSQRPDIISKREFAQSQGGSRIKRKKKPVSTSSLVDIQAILHEALDEIRCSPTDNIVTKSRAITYICSKLADLQERIDTEKRIEALEKRFTSGYLI